ncbi:transposase [Microtetraspora malaysiensis]|uniref:transposase n=1 Tax=Microtetraspora malaysiensis TaxID=161358 RepID=UPI003D930E75
MAEYGDIRKGRHCVFALHAHLVFMAKFRHPVFTRAHAERMEKIMRDVCADFETELAELKRRGHPCAPVVRIHPDDGVAGRSAHLRAFGGSGQHPLRHGERRTRWTGGVAGAALGAP